MRCSKCEVVDPGSPPYCTRSLIVTTWSERSVLEVWIRKGLGLSCRPSGPGPARYHWLGTWLGINSFRPLGPVSGPVQVHADTEDDPRLMFHR